MAGLEILVGTYEEFIVCYRAEPLRTVSIDEGSVALRRLSHRENLRL